MQFHKTLTLALCSAAVALAHGRAAPRPKSFTGGPPAASRPLLKELAKAYGATGGVWVTRPLPLGEQARSVAINPHRRR